MNIDILTLAKLYAVCDRPGDLQMLATARVEMYEKKKLVGHLEVFIKDMIKRHEAKLAKFEQQLKEQYETIKIVEVQPVPTPAEAVAKRGK